MEFSASDNRKLIYFCWTEGLNPPAIAKKINTLIHDGSVSTRTCQRWVSSFENGNFNVADKERTGRPCLTVNNEIQACIYEDIYNTKYCCTPQHISTFRM